MAAGGTYSGTVTVPTQKGVAFAVNFDGIYIPAALIPNDGYQNENDYRHKAEVRDIGGNVMNKLYAGPYQRSKGTLKIPLGSAGATAAAALAQTPLSTISMSRVKTDGTLDTPENWMVEEDTVMTFNREHNEIELSIVKEPGITPA
ncbi:MAG: hypothetical protein WC736_15330 [Gallionella sp.]|jgi:hypothetical protein